LGYILGDFLTTASGHPGSCGSQPKMKMVFSQVKRLTVGSVSIDTWLDLWQKTLKTENEEKKTDKKELPSKIAFQILDC
jgi:uncharacterized protein (DUF2344 family)